MKNKNTITIAVNNELSARRDKLRAEALRFEDLAKNIALDLCLNTEDEASFAKEELLKQHLIRAETFKTAATLLAPAN